MKWLKSEGPVEIEKRPSGTQVVSARLPTALAEDLLSCATRTGVRPSELLRQAIEAFLVSKPEPVAYLSGAGGSRMKIAGLSGELGTENINTVVEIPTEPPQIVAV